MTCMHSSVTCFFFFGLGGAFSTNRLCWSVCLYFFHFHGCVYSTMWTWHNYGSTHFRGSHFSKTKNILAPHSSTLAWKIPWAEEPGRLQSMGWLRVGHDWATSLSLFTFLHWRRKWQPTPVFLPGESQGRGSLVGCRLWGCTELDTTEAT